MPPLSFLLFTVAMCVLWLWCLRAAWKVAPYFAFVLLFETLYSFCTENLAIRWAKSYYYGLTLLQICLDRMNAEAPRWVSHFVQPAALCSSEHSLCIPFAVVAMEAVLIFSTVETSNLLEPPLLVKPFLAGLMALNLDAILDPVASLNEWCSNSHELSQFKAQGLGLWVWLTSPSKVGYWYGVPLSNYVGWFCSAAALTLTVRLGRRYLIKLQAETRVGQGLLIAFLVLIGRLLLEIFLLYILGSVLDRSSTLAWQGGVMLALIGISLAVVLPAWRGFKRDLPFGRDQPLSGALVTAQLFIFVFCLGVLLMNGRLSAGRGSLFAVWLVTFCITTYFVFAPYSRMWFQARRSAGGGR
ncbi:MAG TPA: carotenoid biosynthesis protein [Thermoanaerobaculia bacterium]|nr:carotenoid biosynthesis protein [Thermoanaerobaculia bacterium]